MESNKMSSIVNVQIGNGSGVAFHANINTEKFMQLYSKLPKELIITRVLLYVFDNNSFILPMSVWNMLRSMNCYIGCDYPMNEEEAAVLYLQEHHIVSIMRFLVKKMYPIFDYEEDIEMGMKVYKP